LWGLAEGQDPTTGLLLVTLSVATSIDALAVGLSLAMLKIPVLYPAVVIGVVTAAMSAAGMMLGTRIGPRSQRAMQAVGGLVLIGIGVKILIEHVTV
jgi:putative Mn2+ efflux pump MntP